MSGIVGIGINKEQKHNLVEKLYNSLVYMADLGEEGSGLVLAYKNELKKYREKGNCSFQRHIYNLLSSNRWEVALGNNKKSLEEELPHEAIGPIKIRPKKSSNYNVYISFSGCLLDLTSLRKSLKEKFDFKSYDDAEIAGAIFHEALEKTDSIVEASLNLEERLNGKGFYSAIFLINKNKKNVMVGMRSTTGTTPLCYGQKDGLYCIASESNGLDGVNVEFEDFVKPGEMLLISENGLEHHQISKSKPMICSFQAIYFGSPDAYFIKKGQDIFSLRKALGRQHPFVSKNIEVDAVTYVPMSGLGLAEGLADVLHKSLVTTKKKNLHTVKTFNIAEEERRKAEIARKIIQLNHNFLSIKYLQILKIRLLGVGYLAKGPPRLCSTAALK